MENKQAQLSVISNAENEEVLHQKNFEKIIEHIIKRNDAQKMLKDPSNQVNAIKYISFAVKRNINDLKYEKLLINSYKLTQYNTNISNVFNYITWRAGIEIRGNKENPKIETNKRADKNHLNLSSLDEHKLKELYIKVKDWKKNLIAWNALCALSSEMIETPVIQQTIKTLYDAMTITI